MKEEELFCKLFPEYVVNGKPLSPYFDLFQSGYEEADIATKELEQQIEKMKCCFNCKHSRTEYEHCKTDKHENWEMIEK